MGRMEMDSIIKNVLRNLCCSYGWSYGVFWSFNQQNSLFLTMQDAYYEEETRGLIENLRTQAHMLGGGGIIGQAALTKNHQWMCLDNPNRTHDSSNSICNTFLYHSEFGCQFSSGIETIAAIPVEPQGVVQFGSTEKIMETPEFVNQTRRMFQESVNGGVFEDAYITGGAHDPVEPTCSSACTTQSCFLSSNSQPMLLDHNQLNTWLQPNNIFSQCTSDVSNSALVSFNESLVSESRGLESWNSFSIQSNGQDLFDSLQDFGIPDDLDISKLIPPSFDHDQELIPMNSEEKGEKLMPVINESHVNFNSNQSLMHFHNESNVLGPRNGLFSKLGINELLEGISSTSHAMPSASKRRKTGNSIWEMSSLQAKMEVEPSKAIKKKAKPGTRPRPKDRQQILERMAELRELIPNGNKMSIDCLLDRTIKHMLFLQSVMEHAERIKKADEPKENKDNDPSSNGAIWAYELGNQTMACPLIVEDLSTPGQMLIEMLCEEHGLFLEMVDVIRGFGVAILKGVMEVHEKTWARFIVEVEVKRHVTRQEIFSALVQLLQATCLDDNQVLNMVMEARNPLLDNYMQPMVQLPVSLPQTDYCINL